MIAVLLIVVLMLQPAAPRTVLERWAGRVDAVTLAASPATPYVRTADDLAQLWKAWRLKAELPEIDFSQRLVLTYTGRSSVLQLRAVAVDAAGDLKPVLVATPDMTADYAFIIAVIDRAGVKSIQGVPITPP